jgi:hypothetical protein
MALDVYVMPLWKYKAGEFTSPLEAVLGVEPIVITPTTRPRDPLAGLPWYWRLLVKLGMAEVAVREPGSAHEEDEDQIRENARRSATALKEELTRFSGAPVDWPDEGGVEYSKQFHEPVRIRAFAAWLNNRDTLPEFTAPPAEESASYYHHPAMALAQSQPPPRFATLIEYDAWAGYLFPAPFEGVHGVEPYSQWGHDFQRPVASSQTLLRELEELLPFFDKVPAKVDETGQNPVADAHWRAQQLHKICQLSVQHRLPVIFCG